MNTSTKVLFAGPGIFESEAKEIRQARAILFACGPYVRKVSVGSLSSNEAKAKNFIEEFTCHVFHCCRNVIEVEFWVYQESTKIGNISGLCG